MRIDIEFNNKLENTFLTKRENPWEIPCIPCLLLLLLLSPANQPASQATTILPSTVIIHWAMSFLLLITKCIIIPPREEQEEGEWSEEGGRHQQHHPQCHHHPESSPQSRRRRRMRIISLIYPSMKFISLTMSTSGLYYQLLPSSSFTAPLLHYSHPPPPPTIHFGNTVPIQWHPTPITGDFEASYPVAFTGFTLLFAAILASNRWGWDEWMASRVEGMDGARNILIPI